MTPYDGILLFFAAVFAGGINAIAGGGTFFTFPALLLTGIPPIAANATSTMAVWPGNMASVLAYQDRLRHPEQLPRLVCIYIVGALAGALILLATPERTFAFLVPWLMLVATVLFTFGPRIVSYFRKAPETVCLHTFGSTLALFAVGIYSGYFGGGASIVVLTVLALRGMRNIHEMNAIKVLLGTASCWISVIAFIIAGKIVWGAALLMMAGTVIGGYFGAHYAKQLPEKIVRNTVIVVASCLTVYFFLKG